MIELAIKPTKLHHSFYVHAVLDPYYNIVWIGAGDIAKVTTLSELRRIPDFKHDQVYTIRFLTIRFTQIEAVNAVSIAVRVLCGGHLPLYNYLALPSVRSAEIIEEKTGIIYKNATVAARILNLHQGNISNHLAGKSGFKTVGGYTFRHNPSARTPNLSGYAPVKWSVDPAVELDKILNPSAA